MIVVVHIILLTGLLVWLWKKFPQPIFSIALLLKVAAGIGLGFLYQYYYTTGDTWTFFTDAKHAAAMLRQNPDEFINFFWFDDWSKVSESLGSSGLLPLFLVKWIAVFNLLTGDSYWLVSVYLSLLSFAGAWILYASLSKCFPNIHREAAIAILFVPSVVFWGSGVIKECLALGALFAISGYFIRWYVRLEFNGANSIIAVASLWILWSLKYYWLAVWLGVAIPLTVVKLLSAKNEWVKVHPKRCWALIFLISAIGVSTLHPNFYYYRILSVVVDNYNAYSQLSQPSDAITYSSLKPTLLSMAKNAPWAVISGFFRPFIWESSTTFQAVSGIENLILLVLSVMALVRFKKWKSSFSELHFAMIFYLIVLAAFLALSTPNFGSLSRYRIGFTPFLWLILLLASGVVKYLPKPIQNLLSKS